jgi:hypothetical protein
MIADERHDDFADVDTYQFVCTNHDCKHYRHEVELVVEPGTFTPPDSRDQDCDCGAVLIPVDIAKVAEQVEDEMIKRYKAVGA